MLAVIGDIHGCFFTLKKLCNELKDKYPGVPVYSVGDLVDRGNYSFEVMDFILTQSIAFTPGNHEYMFYYFFHFPDSALAKAWIYNGSWKTLSSYQDKMHFLYEHLKVIINSPLYFDTEDCFISHAGIADIYKIELPEPPLEFPSLFDELVKKEVESENGIFWNRKKLMNLGKLQVVGHTRKVEIERIEENNSVYIDTAAITNNKLTAVLIDNNKIKDIISVCTLAEDTL